MNKILNLKTLNIILAIVFLTLVLFFTRFETTSWNDRSRLSTIKSLVDHHSLKIDSPFFKTGDKIFVDGHFYSDKPPVLSVLASTPYAILKQIGILFEYRPYLLIYITNIFTLSIPLLIYLILLYKNLIKKEKKKNLVFFYTLLVIASTALLPYTSQLNNHLPATLFVGLSTILLLYNKLSLRNSFLIGIFLGFASTFDLSASFITFFICIFYFALIIKNNKITIKEKKLLLISIVIGLLIPFFIHFFINKQITGDIFPGSMHSEYFQYEGSHFTTENLTGANFAVNSFKDWLGELFYMTFGKRGILLHNPTILFGMILALFYSLKEKSFKWKYYSITILLSTLSIILYYSLYGKDAGGGGYLIRWFVVFISLYIPIILRWILHTKKRNLKFFNAILVISIFINIVAMGSVYSSINNVKRFHFINMYHKFPDRIQSQRAGFPKLFLSNYENNYNNSNL